MSDGLGSSDPQAQRDVRDAIESSATPYGDLTVVDRDNRFDVLSDYPLSKQNDIYTAGVEWIRGESEYRLRASQSTESIETVKQLAVSPGYISEAGISLRIPELPTGDQEVRYGYWNGESGIYNGIDSEGAYYEAQRGGVRQGKVRKSAWGREEVDVEQALKDGIVARYILGLYNNGGVGGELIPKDEEYLLRKKNVWNYIPKGQTTLSRQNQPIRIEVVNPSNENFDVFVADRQATVRGQYSPSKRVKGPQVTDVGLDGTTWTPILTIRKKADYDTINIDLFSMSIIADADLILMFRSNAGSTTDTDYENPQFHDPTETAIEVDKSPTAGPNDGFFRWRDLVEGGGGGQSKYNLSNLEIDLELNRTRPMTVFARTVDTAGGNVRAMILNDEENW